jgi:hypothetical protein
MDCDLIVATGAHDVVPELTALRLGPGVGSLVDGDDKLWGFSEQIQELGFGGFHRVILSMLFMVRF